MKIGLSFSRCIKDIWEGKVDSHDVLVIIARTRCNPNDDESWNELWTGYGGGSNNSMVRGFFSGVSNPEWLDIPADKEADFRHLCMELYNGGLIHQPRYFGAHPRRRDEIWLEAVLPSEELEKNPAAKAAWDKFQMVANLTNVTLDEEYR